MEFPGKFELYDEAIEHSDGGYDIKYERYDYQVDIGIKEGKECFTVRYTEDDVATRGWKTWKALQSRAAVGG